METASALLSRSNWPPCPPKEGLKNREIILRFFNDTVKQQIKRIFIYSFDQMERHVKRTAATIPAVSVRNLVLPKLTGIKFF
jgi:hypothetical protein